MVIIAAGSAATGYVDSRCTLTRSFVCSGVVSYMNRLGAAVTKPQRHVMCALTFYSGLAIFSCLALRRMVFLVGIHEVHNFHTVTVFQSMRSSRLPASSAGYAGGKVERNREAVRDREAVRNRRKLVRSGRMKGFASGRWNGWRRGCVWDKCKCSHWKTKRDRESYSDGNCIGEVSGVMRRWARPAYTRAAVSSSLLLAFSSGASGRLPKTLLSPLCVCAPRRLRSIT